MENEAHQVCQSAQHHKRRPGLSRSGPGSGCCLLLRAQSGSPLCFATAEDGSQCCSPLQCLPISTAVSSSSRQQKPTASSPPCDCEDAACCRGLSIPALKACTGPDGKLTLHRLSEHQVKDTTDFLQQIFKLLAFSAASMIFHLFCFVSSAEDKVWHHLSHCPNNGSLQ